MQRTGLLILLAVLCLGSAWPLFSQEVVTDTASMVPADSIYEYEEEDEYSYTGEEEDYEGVVFYPVPVHLVDSSVQQVRQIDTAELSAYYADNDFIYEQAPLLGGSIWDVLMEYWNRMVSQTLDLPIGDLTVYDILVYLLIPFAAAMVIYQLFKAQLKGLFAQDKGEIVNYKARTGDINQADIDTQVQQALAGSNYRLAIRLLYLKSLRRLNDAGLIRWQKNKTNFEYYYELRDENMRRQFYHLTLAFEYAWYGDSPISEDYYKANEGSFHSFIQSIHRR